MDPITAKTLVRNQNWRYRMEILYQIHRRTKLLELPLLPAPTRNDFVTWLDQQLIGFDPSVWDNA